MSEFGRVIKLVDERPDLLLDYMQYSAMKRIDALLAAARLNLISCCVCHIFGAFEFHVVREFLPRHVGHTKVLERLIEWTKKRRKTFAIRAMRWPLDRRAAHT